MLGRKSGIDTSFSSSISVFLCQQHSINAPPYASSIPGQTDEGWEPSKYASSSENWGAMKRKIVHFLSLNV